MYQYPHASLANHRPQPMQDENSMPGEKLLVAGNRPALGDRGNRPSVVPSLAMAPTTGAMPGSTALSARTRTSVTTGGQAPAASASQPTVLSTPVQAIHRVDVPRVPENTTVSPQMDRYPGVRDDVMMVPELTDDVFQHFMLNELKYTADPGYMQRQTDINAKMRGVLVDWLIDVHNKFNLMPETLFLTINLVDRYLALRQTPKSKLQLLGVSAMLIASKYEEIYPPIIKDFVYISAKACSRDDILKTEREILRVLNFNLTVPTVFSFADRFARAAGFSEKQKMMMMFIVEAAQQDINFLRYAPSVIAAAASALTIRYNESVWTSPLVHYTRYTEQSLLTCMDEMNKTIQALAGSRLEALKKKYSTAPRYEVARLALQACMEVAL